MIIENAFFKLPELLTSNLSQRGSIEAAVVHLFGVALQMELNARSITLPFNHVTTEKPYESWRGRGHPPRVDIWVNLDGVVCDVRLGAYGCREQNWIEAKAYFDTPAPTTTENRGSLVRDLLRICLLPEELQGPHRQNGRYILLIIDAHPSYYLGSLQSKKWLKSFLTEGTECTTIDLTKEAETALKKIGKGFYPCPEIVIKCCIRCYSFIPDSEAIRPIFWGYLIRIKSFFIKIGKREIEYGGDPRERWSKSRISKLQSVRNEILQRMGKEVAN